MFIYIFTTFLFRMFVYLFKFLHLLEGSLSSFLSYDHLITYLRPYFDHCQWTVSSLSFNPITQGFRHFTLVPLSESSL